MEDLSRVWKSHVDKLASAAGTPKDLVSTLSARGSQNSYAKAAAEVCACDDPLMISEAV